MNTPVGLFLRCCGRLLDGDDALIVLLQARGFISAPGVWQFTLPSLHRFLQDQLAEGECPGYPVFRQMLFASDVNTRLRALGAEIVVVDNHAKVDSSLYGLRRLAT